jgi:hypothetical protein
MYRSRGLYTIIFWYSSDKDFWFQTIAESPRDCILKMLTKGRGSLVRFGVDRKKIEDEYQRYRYGIWGEREEPTLLYGCKNAWAEGLRISRNGWLEVFIVKTASRSATMSELSKKKRKGSGTGT